MTTRIDRVVTSFPTQGLTNAVIVMWIDIASGAPEFKPEHPSVEAAPARRFYGWAIVAAMFTVQLMVFAPVGLWFGVLLVPMTETLGVGRAAASGATSGTIRLSRATGGWPRMNEALKAMRPKEDWKFHHLGIVVKDLDKALASYEALGILYRVSDLMVSEGKKAKLLGRFIRIGSLNVELWQPVRGNTIQQEFLDTSGEGINHIAFTVEDYDAEYEELTGKQGLPVVFGKNLR